MPGSGAVQPKLLVMEEAWGPGDTPKGLGCETVGSLRPLSLQVGELVWAGQWAQMPGEAGLGRWAWLPPGEAGPAPRRQKGWGPLAACGHSSPTRPSLLPLRLRTFSGRIPPVLTPEQRRPLVTQPRACWVPCKPSWPLRAMLVWIIMGLLGRLSVDPGFLKNLFGRGNKK